ncbi:MAG: patatin-like phospholipase family protein [Proteobacteria bacterium]|nr:patatin-like phospholipase family protein [Pseudomonadota bacterium]
MIVRGIILLLGMIVLASCGGARPTSPPGNLACNLSQYQVRDAYEHIHAFFAPAVPVDINVLELSAGGEFGAYGAGFLKGWRSVGSSAKPIARDDIQIVTGVSTGALMATYAFLATYDTSAAPTWDEQLEQFYLGITDAQIYSKRSTLSLLWANSLFDASGKQTFLRKYLTTDVINRVARAPEGRRLYVGFANLDSGEFLRIDMVALAKGTFESTARRDDCYRAVIDAATAQEIAFPPVFIDGQMMADGGVRQHVFLVSPDQAQPDADLSRLRLRTIALVHGNLEVTPMPSGVKNGVLTIAERSASILLDQSLKSSVRLSNALSHDPAVVVGPAKAKTLPRFQTYYGAAAKAACSCDAATRSQCNPDDLFCHAFMQCLAAAGEKEGAAAASTGKWLEIGDLDLGSKPSCQLPARVSFR